MFKRRRFKQTQSLTERLTTFAKLMRERAETMPPGTGKAAILAKAKRADIAAAADEWMDSSELKRPE